MYALYHVCIIIVEFDTKCFSGHFNEEFSDRCMGEIMGTYKKGSRPCSVSSDCLQTMMSKGFDEYTLTHQLLFSYLAEHVSIQTYTAHKYS